LDKFDDTTDVLPDNDPEPKGGIPGFVLPLITAVVALLAGGVIGAVIVFLIVGLTKPEVVEVARNLTPEELEQVCSPLILEAFKELEEANGKVETLEARVSAKEMKVVELEDEMKRRSVRGAALVRELEEAKAELITLRAELEVAIQEKEALVIELEETVEELEKTQVELEDQKEETRVAQEDALANKWLAFTNDSQLEICEKGNRKKMGRCRSTVLTSIDPAFKERFHHCVRSGQATPSVHEATKNQRKGLEDLPEFSEYIDQEDKITKDWYVLLCDPTLPEAEGMVDDDDLPSKPIEEDDFDFDFEDLDLEDDEDDKRRRNR
jgi:hypothetical protein